MSSNTTNNIVDMKICPNCSREVAKSNFALHETHCAQNFYTCPKCSEVVNLQQRSQHDQSHMEIPCECGTVLEERLMAIHQSDECSHRMISCRFCELLVKYSTKEEHEDYCGNRTDSCELCNQYIRLKEFELHIESGCTFPSPKPKKSNAEERLRKLREETLQYFSENPNNGDDTLIPCEICNDLISLVNLLDHQVECGVTLDEDQLIDELDHEILIMGLNEEERKKKKIASTARKNQRRQSLQQALLTSDSTRKFKHQPPPLIPHGKAIVDLSKDEIEDELIFHGKLPKIRPSVKKSSPGVKMSVKASSLSAAKSRYSNGDREGPLTVTGVSSTRAKTRTVTDTKKLESQVTGDKKIVSTRAKGLPSVKGARVKASVGANKKIIDPSPLTKAI